MRVKHGFFIPDGKYCDDITGLVHYLRERIEIGLLCINCNNTTCKNFQSS